MNAYVINHVNTVFDLYPAIKPGGSNGVRTVVRKTMGLGLDMGRTIFDTLTMYPAYSRMEAEADENATLIDSGCRELEMEDLVGVLAGPALDAVERDAKAISQSVPIARELAVGGYLAVFKFMVDAIGACAIEEARFGPFTETK
jgi:hypothetical protein